MITERVVEFLGHLLRRSDTILERHDQMATDLTSILTKLTDQGEQIAAQGRQIDSLIAARSAQEQADLEKIAALIDANGAASKGNADKLVGALTPATSSDAQAAPVAVIVAAPVVTGSTSIPIAADTAPVVGSSVAGGSIAAGTTVADGTTASTLVVDTPTSDDHVGGEALTITPPAAAQQ